jgi:AraC-like DNA-binding protein
MGWTFGIQGRTLKNMADPWSTEDPLGEALHFLRMSGVFYSRCEFSEPFGLALPPFSDCMIFHVMISGRCWVDVDEANRLLLESGDLALVPHGEGHVLLSEPGGAASGLFDIPHEEVSDRYEIIRLGGGGALARMVCGVVRFDHPAAFQLIKILPGMIRIEASNSPESEWIQTTLRLMAAEARDLRPGGETVMTRLADIVVIQAIRAWIAQDPAGQSGWLGALQDKQIGRAISLIHRDPGRDWTVASLADEVAMSRSAFAARFTELVGEPAMQYVTRWRMNVALTWLKEDDAPLVELAERLGYQSEAAFSRAFKRSIGVAPGAARRRAGAALVV